MQISITNGTLSQVQETLSASSGYSLPSSVTVTGATSSYDSSTGSITLTNITSTMSITATGEVPVSDNKIFLGSLSIEKMFIGNYEIEKMYLGDIEIYAKGSSYDYSSDNGELTINNAPYSFDNGNLEVN